MYSFPYTLLGITQGYFIPSHSGAAGLAESRRRMCLKASWYISGRALLLLHKSSASGEMRFGARKPSRSAVIWCIRIDFFRCKKPRQWYMREHKSYFFFILDGCDSAMSHHQLSLSVPVVCCSQFLCFPGSLINPDYVPECALFLSFNLIQMFAIFRAICLFALILDEMISLNRFFKATAMRGCASSLSAHPHILYLLS